MIKSSNQIARYQKKKCHRHEESQGSEMSNCFFFHLKTKELKISLYMFKMMFSYFCLRLSLPLLPQRGAAALLLPHMWGSDHAAGPMHFSLTLTCCRGHHQEHPCRHYSNLGPAGQARCINDRTLISEQAV